MFRSPRARSVPAAPPVAPRPRPAATAPPQAQRELRMLLRDLANAGERPELQERVSEIDLRDAVEAAVVSLRR